jgi:hypothetical protein
MTGKEAYIKAIELGIEVPGDLSDTEIERVYNGVGPEFLAGWIRGLLDYFFEVFLPAVWRHDQRFAHGDGTLIDFMGANRELADNCRICADAEYGALNPLRYLARWVGEKFGKACVLLGLPAYLQAIEETKQYNTNKENKT